MTLILKQFFNFLKILNSDTGTNQIAAGIAVGFVLGLAPFFSLQTLLMIVFILLFRVQAGAAFATAFFFGFLTFFLDPVFHPIGQMVLENPSLTPVFTTLYHMPIVPFTRFNNSVIMGAGVVSIAVMPIMFFLGKVFVVKYREKIVKQFQETKFWKFVKSTSLFKWYAKYDQLFG